MEIGRRNILTEHEIEAVLQSQGEDRGWDLILERRIEPVTLEVLPAVEANRDPATVINLGHIAEEGADIHRPLAA